MKLTSLILAVLLVGCSTPVPVKQKFPNAPAILLERCPQLMELPEDQNNIKNFMGIVIQNYGTYYQCAEKVQGWQEWYKENQKIMNGK